MSLTKKQAKKIRLPLFLHEGRTLMPDWSQGEQAELTEALDVLRGMLLNIEKRGEKNC